MGSWLLTGGAGYIGAHVARALLRAGEQVAVLDDLSTGHAELVPDGVTLYQANVCDVGAVARALRESNADGVVHLAAKKAVGESVEHPLYYYRENVDGILGLLEAMAEVGTSAIVYSSSAAVYGAHLDGSVSEGSPLVPQSPYGETKVIGEWAVAAQARARAHMERPLSYVFLRYFNVAGAGSGELGDTGVANLIPMVLRAYTQGDRPKIFGNDYATPDGTCVRDYIHVADLANAHIAAAQACLGSRGDPLESIYNVGRGKGSSVRDVIAMVSDVVGEDVNAQDVARRPGDPAILVAQADRITEELGWRAQYDLRDMVSSAWQAWQVTH